MRHWIALATIVTAVAALPAAVAAQSPYRGMWLGLGAGAGSSLVTCAVCIEDREGGPSGYLRIGGTVSPSILIGGEGTLWAQTSDDLDKLVGAVNGVVLLYPRPGTGFHVKGGLGVLRFQITDPEDADDTARVTSLGVQLGVGYDLPVSPGYSVTPFLNLVASSYGSLEQGNEVLADQVNVTLIQFGVGLSAH
jgi:hypothetical protein